LEFPPPVPYQNLNQLNRGRESAMHESEGDLLIGGDRIKHVPVDLEDEQPQADSREWVLTGHLHLTPAQSQLVETDRPYRLQLADGRAGQVIVSRLAEGGRPDELLADFQPKRCAEKPR
jgi:hypothetical protein